MKEAPLFVRTFDLCVWFQTLPLDAMVVGRVAQEEILRLLNDVTLAFKGNDREERLESADARCAVLRVQARLLNKLGLLDDRRLLFMVEGLDEVGRQIGGWLKRLSQDTVPVPLR